MPVKTVSERFVRIWEHQVSLFQRREKWNEFSENSGGSREKVRDESGVADKKLSMKGLGYRNSLFEIQLVSISFVKNRFQKYNT